MMEPITVSRYDRSRHWAVRDGAGELICLCVYKRGALEVARRLAQAGQNPPAEPGHEFSKSPLDTLRESPY